MSTVVMHNVVSVDGFIAGADDQSRSAFEWYFNGDTEIVEGSTMNISKASAEYVRPMWASIRSMVIGRHLFDLTNGWEGRHWQANMWSSCRTGRSPTGGTRRRRTTFSTTSHRSIATAKKLADERIVVVAASDVGGQAFALGLVDELAMDVVLVVFGSGKRYFGSVDTQPLLEDPTHSDPG